VPVVRLYIERMRELLEFELRAAELEEYILSLKGEVERLEEGEGWIEAEFTMDRPDLLISEGLARAIKGLAGIELGFPELEVRKSECELRVGSVPSRPFIAVGIVKDYPLDGKTLEELIQFQEKLHLTVGRKRRKVAIGIHDLEKTPSRTLEYKMVSLSEEMIPLGYSSRMTVEEVLRGTHQGKLYGELSLSGSSHPAITAGEEIISLPPVINSDVTRLEEGTRNLLIDVTGTDQLVVLKTLDLIASILAERKGAHIELCKVEIGEESYFTPGLTPSFIETSPTYVSTVLGLDLSEDEIARLGEKMRWEVVVGSGVLRAGAPEYRLDVLHPIDFVEDVAIAYGYSNFQLSEPLSTTKPKELGRSRFKGIVKRALIGLGFTQVRNFTMVSDYMASLAPEGNVLHVKILNPISAEMSSVRASIVPSLLQTLRESQKYGLPLKVFEIGHFAYIDRSSGSLVSGEKVAMALADYRVGYEDIQSNLTGFLKALGVAHRYQRCDAPIFIPGRSACVLAGGELLGYVGEVHPQVLTESQVKHPVGAAELYLEAFYRVWQKG